MEDREIRFGVVGCGAIGPTHAGAIARIAGAKMLAVADLVGERARKTAEKFGVPRIYPSMEKLLEDRDIDVVCLATPTGMHADGAIAAMEAGKHVIVEKPMEVSLEACDRMIAAAEQMGKKLTVISQHRFDASTMLLKKLIDTGELGKIFLADATVKWWRRQEYYDSGDWRGTWALDGGGALMNQGVHTVDVLQWLVGGVASVYAHTLTAAHDRIEVEDVAVAALRFRNGAVGTLIATTAAYDGLPVRIDIFGTGGSATLEGDNLTRLSLKSGKIYQTSEAADHAVSVARGGTNSVRDSVTRVAHSAPAAASWGDAHQAQLEDFVQAIRTDTNPLITPRAAREPVEIILSAYRSAKSGQAAMLLGNRQ
ncbi:MAG TPA: Gfo/Idh/MocA family oxidoreductase [Tepidisphaeraceae bacterium]|nr:Gfo/Idh/MocA family oxidoreductase [Tepidisphaeraceae bacterium]